MDMYAVVRSYSGAGAKELFDLIQERRDEVEDVMRAVTGLVNYSIIATSDGGVAVTVCHDREGTDQSSQIAREWIMANASHIKAAPPTVAEGPVVIHLD